MLIRVDCLTQCEKSVIQAMCLIEVEMKGKKLKEYSIMLALLTRLFAEEYISKSEYEKMKQNLMTEFGIISDLTV